MSGNLFWVIIGAGIAGFGLGVYLGLLAIRHATRDAIGRGLRL